MTYELGRAQFIVDFQADAALQKQAQVYNDITTQAKAVSETLAKQLKVRESDVKNSASVIINEEKKAAQERLKIAKQVSDDNKKTTQELLKFNQKAYQDDLNEQKRIQSERIKAAKETARQQLETERAALRQSALERRQAADQAKREERQRQQEQTRPQNAFIRGLPGDVATIAGFGAIASGAIIVRQAIITTTESITKQEQAVRSLNAAFGETSAAFKNTADNLASQFVRVQSEVEKAAASFGVLQKQSNLSGEEINKLQKVAIDLQSAYGGDLQEAFRSVGAAVLGETEALEKYGIVLQEGVLKNGNLLTEEEKRRFTTMSESEKQLIRYRALLQLSASAQGEATARAKGAQGGFDALARSTDELAKAIGKGLVPAAGEGSRELAKLTSSVATFMNAYAAANERIEKDAQLKEQRERIKRTGGIIGNIPFLGDFLADAAIIAVNPQAERQRQIAEDQQRYRELELANIKQHNADVAKAQQAARDKEEAELKEARQRIEAGLKRAHDIEIKRIDDEIKAAEGQKTLRLRALEDAHKAELGRLKEVEEARERAAELELARIQNEKEKAIEAADARKANELERLETEQEARREVTAARIRDLEIERDEKLKQAESTRDIELERLEDEKQARDKARREEDNKIEDSVKKKERILEDSHKKTLRRIEAEKDKARESSEDEQQHLDDLIKKEARRHQKRVQQIDDEREKQLDLLNDQIEGLQKIARTRQNTNERNELQSQIGEAELAVRQATGTGGPAERTIAQEKLIRARRINDAEAIKKAEQELAEVVGHGAEAVQKAEKDLNKIREQLRDKDLDQSEDAQIEKLKDEQERIRKEAEAEKRQEDERNRKREDRLARDKRAESERLEDVLSKIDKKLDRENDANEKAKREQADLTKFNSRQLEERRKDEDVAYGEAQEVVRNRYKTERDEVDETYNGARSGYIPALRRALAATEQDYKSQKEAAEKRYKDERAFIFETFDDPEKGLIAVHRRAEEDAKNTYARITSEAAVSYEAARRAVSDAYNAPDGTSGIIDKLQVLKDETNDKLRDVLDAFDLHAKGLVAPGGIIEVQWSTALDQAKRYFDFIDAELKKKRQVNSGVNITPSTRQGPATDDSGIQIGPDPMPGNNQPLFPGGARGIGTSPDIPGNTAPTGSPDPETQTSVSLDPDEIGNRFSVSFGYAQPYSGSYTPGPGWDGKAAWPGGPSHHKGVDLIVPGAQRNGYGSPVPAFVAGRVLRTVPDSRGPGGNMVIIDVGGGRTNWYLHLKDYTVSAGQQVRRGDIIAHLGDTGTEEFPHLHYEVRNGDTNGPMSLDELRRDGIDPLPFVRGRDSGYTFRNPTLTYDMRTGEQNVIAERRPEILIGGAQTQKLMSMGINRNLARPAVMGMDSYGTGAAMSNVQTSVSNVKHEGDKLTYNGVAPENLLRQWRDDQRKQRALRGRHGTS